MEYIFQPSTWFPYYFILNEYYRLTLILKCFIWKLVYHLQAFSNGNKLVHVGFLEEPTEAR